MVLGSRPYHFHIISSVQSNPDIVQPSLSAHKSLWTEIYHCTGFWFTATPMHCHKL